MGAQFYVIQIKDRNKKTMLPIQFYVIPIKDRNKKTMLPIQFYVIPFKDRIVPFNKFTKSSMVYIVP